jgi:hypothetical protein
MKLCTANGIHNVLYAKVKGNQRREGRIYNASRQSIIKMKIKFRKCRNG